MGVTLCSDIHGCFVSRGFFDLRKFGLPKQPGKTIAESRRVVGFDAAQESQVVIKPELSCICTILHDEFDTIRPVDHCDNHDEDIRL